ncbi:helix-turn-helix domain-containing protein [Achromobacter aloeverae]|uniref:DNA-binding protein n=1 Tax=Achromobacter aloeverae TaxID=1750518 RepID=A0A4Q1HCR2_9BURK|nr:helix-turn-helix domain-containing protein [Achromobacter aloeverae]RXN83659.1 DNA-binding protein [Achromobacter aloeverae]
MFLTVEDAAARLRIHPKTVLRYIREQRLPAAKIGKSYRIADADLAAFAPTRATAAAPRSARATCIVDIPDASQALHRYLARSLHAMTAGRPARDAPMRVDLAYDPATSQLKVIVMATPADTAALLSALQTLLENGAR